MSGIRHKSSTVHQQAARAWAVLASDKLVYCTLAIQWLHHYSWHSRTLARSKFVSDFACHRRMLQCTNQTPTILTIGTVHSHCCTIVRCSTLDKVHRRQTHFASRFEIENDCPCQNNSPSKTTNHSIVKPNSPLLTEA